MNKQDIQFLYDYNYWANARILAASAKVTPEQFVAPANLSHGSLRATLVHTLGTEVVWRRRCQEGHSVTAMLSESELSTLETLTAYWHSEEVTMRAYLGTLTDDGLNQPIKYKTLKGVPHENTLWNLLAHVVNHGTQFRSEAAVALTVYGQSPGDLDLLLFFRQK
jgi:uncharacterized damage-inducible protein DinB